MLPLSSCRRLFVSLLPTGVLTLVFGASCGGPTGPEATPAAAPDESRLQAPRVQGAKSDTEEEEGRPGSSAPVPEASSPGDDGPPGEQAVQGATGDTELRNPEPPPLPGGTTVLHIGDSFAGALGYELNRELEALGVQGVLKYEKSTYIPTWAWKKDFPSYLWKYKPDLILVTLGGNELGIAEPEKRAETVRRLIQRFDGIPCVWIGIPLWEGANPKLMRVIEENSAPCQFLDSHALIPDMQRAKDNIHPSLSARTRWAKTVVAWLAEHRRPDGDKPWSWKDERR